MISPRTNHRRQGWRPGCLALLLALAGAGCASRPPAPAPTPGPASRRAAPSVFTIHCALTVKGGTLAELRGSLGAAQTCFEAKVQPYGIRLFDLPHAGLAYDRARQELQVRLDHAVCARFSAALTGAVARVAVYSLDCVLFYDVDTATGRARQMERYEVDYLLSGRPGAPCSQWHDHRLTINGQPADWDLFISDGLHYDWLPPVLNIRIEGRDAQGQPRQLDIAHRNQTLQTLVSDGGE